MVLGLSVRRTKGDRSGDKKKMGKRKMTALALVHLHLFVPLMPNRQRNESSEQPIANTAKVSLWMESFVQTFGG